MKEMSEHKHSLIHIRDLIINLQLRLQLSLKLKLIVCGLNNCVE